MSQSLVLSKRPHIIIATPGRLVDHLENTKGFNMKTLKYLVLDEADRLLDLDFDAEIEKILKCIPRERRTFLFSATMTSKVEKLQRASLTNPVRVEVSTKYSTVSSLLQYYIFLPFKHKETYLTYLLNEHTASSVIIFTLTCLSAQKLTYMLRNLSFPSICLHGQMSQSSRLAALSKFKSKSSSILVCTDVASRGLDIPHVDLVLNYDVPSSSKDYIHRVGRTARAGRAGKAVTLVTQYDIEWYQRIEHSLGRKLEEFTVSKEEVLVLSERVGESIRLATIQIKDEGRKGKNGRQDKRGLAVRDADDEESTMKVNKRRR